MERFAIATGVLATACSLSLGGVVNTLDFETEDDFLTPLVNGQAISSPTTFGTLVNINAFGVNNLGAAVFDSSPAGPNAGGQDPDLLVGLGNVLILQSPDAPTQSLPGIFDSPNDALGGGTFVFDFIDPVEMLSVKLLDVDGGNEVLVTLVDTDGRVRIYSVPAGWSFDLNAEGPNGYDTLDLTTLSGQMGEGGSTATAFEDAGFDAQSVSTVFFEFSGSGGLDDVSFIAIPTPGAASLLALAGGASMLRRRRD